MPPFSSDAARRKLEPKRFDCVVGSDLLYDPSSYTSLLKTLEQTTGELGELVKRLDVRTKKTLQDSIGIEKVTYEETVTELP